MAVQGPTYTSEDYWADQQQQAWSDEMDTLDTFSNPAAQLKFIVEDLALFVSDTNLDYIFWDSQYMDATQGLLEDLDTIKQSYNDVVSNYTTMSYDQWIDDATTAMDAANQILLTLYTDPLFSDNTALQDQFVNSFSDLFECDPNDVTFDVTIDGTTEPMKVPQFDPNAEYEEGITYAQRTAGFWSGWIWNSPTPQDRAYQGYLQKQSDWNSDLMVMTDSLDDQANHAQAEMQQGEQVSQQIDGTWHDTMRNFSKGIADQINNQISN